MTQPTLLTGDTPTGQLHLGHWVGSIANRVKLQQHYNSFLIIANMHAFSTRWQDPQSIRDSVLDITLDYLAAGIDPNKTDIFIQSEIPAIAELTFLFSMLTPYNRLMRNPTIKSEIKDKQLGDSYPFGFLLYPIGQIADILAFRPEVIPVGEDQLPHLEMTREIARRFNHTYCNDDNPLFPDIQPLISETPRLPGLGAPNEEGYLLKMSKSLNNAILLSDDADTVKKKIMSMYTDPNRIRPTDPGTTENNPLWIFHDTFNSDTQWVEDAKQRYREGRIGDVECKKRLVEVVNELLEPMRQRRQQWQQNSDEILKILQAGTEKANELAETTLQEVKRCIKQDYFTPRSLTYPK